MPKQYEVIIIGGGFYGLRLAQFLKQDLHAGRVLVIEKEKAVMRHASYNNQARVHNGYHYPRSILTALRSRVNLPIFSNEYSSAIVKDFDTYYAVATQFSKVSGKQFQRFFERIGAEIEKAPEVRHLFDTKLIEEIFKVKEYAFDASLLKKQLLKALANLDVDIQTNEQVVTVAEQGQKIRVTTNQHEYVAKFVINTTYSSINAVNEGAGLPIIPLKHELTELCLVEPPAELLHKAFTVMCGPFFSLMPFPAQQAYSLSHVRYTPHAEWTDSDGTVHDSHAALARAKLASHFPQMLADMKRFMPIAGRIAYSGKSLWEIKTVLPQSETDDSRPILYKVHHGGLHNYICIMGGKIDNIYDVFRELKTTYEAS